MRLTLCCPRARRLQPAVAVSFRMVPVQRFPVQYSLPLALSATLLVALALVPAHSRANSTAYTQGKELFATKGCAHCHGVDGINGERGPDLQEIRKRMSAVQITTQIHDGSKSMPAFGEELTPPEIKDLVAYLRTKRKKIVKPPPAPPAPKPDPDAGF
jgi:mono/diheme cytochrome c family protein